MGLTQYQFILCHFILLHCVKTDFVSLPLTLIWGVCVCLGGNFTPCWFSLNNSETVKAVTLAFHKKLSSQI